MAEVRPDIKQEQLADERQARTLEIIRLLRSSPNALLGTLRTLLAPADTSAFPPSVLGLPVNKTAPTIAKRGRETARVYGLYDFKNKTISISPWENIDNPLLRWWLYRTLLHEGGHARAYSALEEFTGTPPYPTSQYGPRMDADTTSIPWLRQFNKLYRNTDEDFAEGLADSILKR